MKKIVLIALVALCSVSFGDSVDDFQMRACVEIKTTKCSTENECSIRGCRQTCKELASNLCEKLKQESGKKHWYHGE